jgi:hypothetical protein
MNSKARIKLAETLRSLGYKPILDAHCMNCGKLINATVDGRFCGVYCQICFSDKHKEQANEQ